MNTRLPIIKENNGKNTSAVQVAVLFEDPRINQLFCDLLATRGVNTRIINSLADIESQERIITEPQYAIAINSETLMRCLVVGNKDVLKDLPALPLSRPLTEEKIEQALAKFLA